MILSPPSGSDNSALAAWARRLIDDLNRFFSRPQDWPVFADDAAAADGRLKVGEPYVTPTGELRRRVA